MVGGGGQLCHLVFLTGFQTDALRRGDLDNPLHNLSGTGTRHIPGFSSHEKSIFQKSTRKY